MAYTQKNALGSGDATFEWTNSFKKRTHVPSSRRFATRGVTNDPSIQNKLRKAIEEFETPPQTPVNKRSQTIAEIIQTEKRTCPKCKVYTQPKKIIEARKIAYTLMLKAWRSTKQKLEENIQSTELLKSNLENYKMQAHVLQDLQVSEGKKRMEAINENNLLHKDLEGFEIKYDDLQRAAENLAKREEGLREEKKKLQINVEGNEEIINVLKRENSLSQQAYEAEKQKLQDANNQKKTLSQNVEELNLKMQNEEMERKKLNHLLKMSESKYEECEMNFRNLLKNCAEIDRRMYEISKENEEYQTVLQGMTYKTDEQENKILELKKNVSINKRQREQLEEKVESLKNSLLDYEVRINQQLEKRWWKSSGEFIINSLQSFAYVIFPALPVI